MDISRKKLIFSNIIDNSITRHENFKIARLIGITNAEYQAVLETVVDEELKPINYLMKGKYVTEKRSNI